MLGQIPSCEFTVVFIDNTTIPYFPKEVKRKIKIKQSDNGNENHCRSFEIFISPNPAPLPPSSRNKQDDLLTIFCYLYPRL
ncbi:MAG: hypothetical protein D3908_12355 [Candidatus Electrothrix sp. AUS4]|nr:hypothetical protein [Candidatus Electrothrix sp. AUS4]